ncbi:GNAT family N-acetyltransferase [Ktedonobacter robiniae]|uniref:N-acetyltransferase domain-containing protein n=1 Tax=Ktedonobacter robiniae TaxID=2778365 RepID=A0ABQ3UW68_9CHLR|nr:GNAT family N-acetyltransferase [Ktedonobacter robiniae]GHO56910.1 hypothetical protein KSB_53850 [Ktedonobacter robiniae]
MPLGTWWRGDNLPQLPPLPSFSARTSTDTSLITGITELSTQEVKKRLGEENLFYIAYMEETPTSYGWVATREGYILEFQLFFPIHANERYLWDFRTLPEWRGLGIYPHLLQGIMRQEPAQVERFWIGYAPGNEASRRGISKAGFHFVGEFAFDGAHKLSFETFDMSERSLAGAAFYQLPILVQKPSEQDVQGA